MGKTLGYAGRKIRFFGFAAALALGLIGAGLQYNVATSNGFLSNSMLITQHRNRKSSASKSLGTCPLPQQTSKWKYYQALVDANLNTTSLASKATEYIPSTSEQSPSNSRGRRDRTSDNDDDDIPHRIVFTHKQNLFDCEISASNSTSPELYTLAENTKATASAYRNMWPDVEIVFLADDDCIQRLNTTKPELLHHFKNLEGMYKADLCRAADLLLYGGYYFDVDILLVRPYVAQKGITFATVKGASFPKYGFFQAFMAASKANNIISRSLDIMLEALQGKRPRGKWLGPTALMEAWMEVKHITNATEYTEQENGVHLLTETTIGALQIKKNEKLPKQEAPTGHGPRCQFSGGACNYIVVDENDRNVEINKTEAVYFYSRVLGTRWCGKWTREDC